MIDFTAPPSSRPYFHISSEKWDMENQRNALLHYVHEHQLDDECLNWVKENAPEGWFREGSVDD